MPSANYPTAFDALVHPTLISRTPDAVTVTLRVPVTAASDVLAGHYPGFPILPGVLIIDCLRQAIAASAGPGVRLTAVERMRLVNPLLPGDEMTFIATTSDRAESDRTESGGAESGRVESDRTESGRTVVGRGVRSDGRVAAEIRARFETVAGDA